MTEARRLLIVDDDQFVRALLKDLLAPDGYAFVEASNGEDALEKARADAPDAILLDLLMPKMSGIEALRALRKMVPQSRVLVISSLDSDSLVDQALEEGAAGFVVKPFHPLEIKEAVRQVLLSER